MSEAPATERWEAAYRRFESPRRERAKFLRRLRALGVHGWDRNLRIVELFCGRGGALDAWLSLGFRNVEGLDISEALVAEYRGPAALRVGDARDLPFADRSRDVIAVQGGLHHLVLMNDLRRVLAETRRVLRPGGRLVVVEPWLTPFLRLAHAACARAWCRRLWDRLDALAEMIELERPTYEDWLARPQEILESLRGTVEPEILRVRRGKLMLVGVRRAAP